MDNALIISEVKQSCLHPVTPEPSCDISDEESVTRTYAWKPLLLFISLRLGLSEINPVYKAGLKKCFSLPSSLGVIGGSPNHALYLLGCVDDEVTQSGFYQYPISRSSPPRCCTWTPTPPRWRGT